jgi:hypothetical protein
MENEVRDKQLLQAGESILRKQVLMKHRFKSGRAANRAFSLVTVDQLTEIKMWLAKRNNTKKRVTNVLTVDKATGSAWFGAKPAEEEE